MTKQYQKEIMEMEKYFMIRYNLVRQMKDKMNSLKFIKNGKYKNKILELQDIENQLNNEFIEEVKFLYEQPNLIQEEVEKLKKYEFLVQRKNQITNIDLGGPMEKMIMKKRKKQKELSLLKQLQNINREYQQNGIVDAKYKLKEISVKAIEYEKEDTENIYLTSKMIRHLSNFLDISQKEASMLLHNFTYDKVININQHEVDIKNEMIDDELNSYEPIVKFLYATHNKTFVCPYCSYQNNLDMNVTFHISTIHSNEYIEKDSTMRTMTTNVKEDDEDDLFDELFGDDDKKKNEYFIPGKLLMPILIIEPYQKDNKYINIYDDKIFNTNKEAIYHLKMNNKIIKKKNYGFEKIPESDRQHMFNTAVHSKYIKMIPNKTEMTVKPDEIMFKNKLTIKIKNNPEQNQKVLKTYVETLLSKMKFFTSEYDEILSFSNKMIEECKHFHNQHIARRWVHSSIIHYFLKKYFNYFEDIEIKMMYESLSTTITFDNIDNIPNKIPQMLEINGRKIIENSVFVNDSKDIEISKNMLIETIKTEVIIEKVNIFIEKLVEKLTYNKNESRISTIRNEMKFIHELFRKILHKQHPKYNSSYRLYDEPRIHDFHNVSYDFDLLISKLKNLNENNMYSMLLDDANLDEKFASGKEIDNYLYFILLSFLPNDNPAVLNTYNIIEENEKEPTDFPYKNQVWNWYKKYNPKEDTQSNFKNLSLYVDKLFPDNKEDSLEREITNYTINDKHIYEQLDFNSYILNENDILNRRDKKKFELYKREKIIENIILDGVKHQIVKPIDYKMFMALQFLFRLEKALSSEQRKTRNAQIVYRFLKILDISIEKPKIYRKVKNKFGIKRLQQTSNQNKNKNQNEERKEDLLNDFMNLNEEQMHSELVLNRELNMSGFNQQDKEEDIDLDLDLDVLVNDTDLFEDVNLENEMNEQEREHDDVEDYGEIEEFLPESNFENSYENEIGLD